MKIGSIPAREAELNQAMFGSIPFSTVRSKSLADIQMLENRAEIGQVREKLLSYEETYTESYDKILSKLCSFLKLYELSNNQIMLTSSKDVLHTLLITI